MAALEQWRSVPSHHKRVAMQLISGAIVCLGVCLLPAAVFAQAANPCADMSSLTALTLCRASTLLREMDVTTGITKIATPKFAALSDADKKLILLGIATSKGSS